MSNNALIKVFSSAKPRTVSGKIIVGAVTSLIVVLGAITVFQQTDLRDFLYFRFEHEGMHINTTLDASLRHAMMASDSEAISSMLSYLSETPQVKRAFILNESGKFMQSSDNSSVGSLLPEEQRALVEDAEEGYFAIRQDRGGRSYSAYISPIRAETRCLVCHTNLSEGQAAGYIGIERWADEDLARAEGKLTTLILLNIGCIVVLAAFLAYALRKTTNPLKQITQVAKRIAVGDIDQELDFESTDEVGSLAESFRQLIQYIKHKSEVAQAIGNGDMSVKVHVASDEDVLGRSFKRLETSISNLVQTNRQLIQWAKDGDLDKRANPAEHPGTFGDLVQGFNDTLDALLTPVNDASLVLQKVAIKDLSIRLNGNLKGQHAKIRDAVNTAIKGMSEALNQIGISATSLSDSAGQLGVISEQMRSNAESSSVQANTVSVASERINANIRTIATGVSQMGGSIREIAKDSGEAAKVATTAVRVSSDVNTVVAKLGESSNEIGKVIKVIKTIAEQTNLLALNATIEAARAGEAGKGFAVVATEVKELAKETSQATEDINRRIEAIQADADCTAEAIGQIGTIVNQISELQNSIACAVEEQTAVTSEMARNLNVAAEACTEISHNMSSVAQAATETTDGAVKTSEAATQLASMAGHLRLLMGQFTT